MLLYLSSVFANVRKSLRIIVDESFQIVRWLRVHLLEHLVIFWACSSLRYNLKSKSSNKKPMLRLSQMHHAVSMSLMHFAQQTGLQLITLSFFAGME